MELVEVLFIKYEFEILKYVWNKTFKATTLEKIKEKMEGSISISPFSVRGKGDWPLHLLLSNKQHALMWEFGIYLEVVNITLCPHYHFVGWDRLSAGTACPAMPEQSANTKTQNAQCVMPLKSKNPAAFSPPPPPTPPPLPSSHLM